MHAVVRMYSGAGGKKLIDLLEESKKEVEALIRPAKGFVSCNRDPHCRRRCLGDGL